MIKNDEIKFDKKTHTYYLNGKKVPSVTQIIALLDKSQPLMYWAVNTTLHYLSEHISDIKEDKMLLSSNANKIFYEAKKQHRLIKKKAADVGTRTHFLIEKYLKKQPYKDLIDEETFKPFSAFKKWIANQDFELINSELIVWSKKYLFAGTVDAIVGLGKEKKKVYILDLKTSKDFYEPNYLMQLSAYRIAIEELDIANIKGMGILRLDKKTGMPFWKSYLFPEYEWGSHLFLSLTKYWHILHCPPRNSRPLG